jgi:surfeit locus 1 family protein
MYRFLRKPRWLAFLLLGLVGAIAMPILGQWQLDRYHQRQRENKVVQERRIKSPVPLRSVIPNTSTIATLPDVEWRQVTVSGTYDIVHQILIANRSYKGRPGYHVLTPLLIDGEVEQAVLINRGFVPYEAAVGGPLPEAPPQSGTVTLQGVLRPTQTKGGIGPTDPEKGILKEMARIDIERISRQNPNRLAPAYIELTGETPTPAQPLSLVEPPKQDAGTNLSYAMQWFIFTAVGLITWPIIIRREASKRKKARASS